MNRLFVGIVSVFVFLAIFLIYQAKQAGASVVLTPIELLEKTKELGASAPELRRIRVAGRVAEGEIQYQVEPSIELRFLIGEPGKSENEQKKFDSEDERAESGKVSVLYRGIKPDMFAVGRDVIIDGRIEGDVLVASTLLTQCPSKYEAPNPEDIDYSAAEQ